MKTTIQDVESFLKEFKAAMVSAGIIVIERDKNLQGMFSLGINPAMRKLILESLAATDYYRGPSSQSGWVGEAWEFGKMVNNIEAYIKVSMGVAKTPSQTSQKEVGPARPVICISFHPAQGPIIYPFKN